MLCQHLGRAVLGQGRAVLGLGRAVLSQARAVARPGQGRLAVEGRALRVLVVLLVLILQDVEDLGSWAVRTGQTLGSHSLSGNTPVQANGVPGEPGQGLDQAAEVALPILRRGSRVKTKVTPYQAGDSGMG